MKKLIFLLTLLLTLPLQAQPPKHIMLPMRDNTQLSTYLYLPSTPGPYPTLYEQRYTPFTSPSFQKIADSLTSQGYAVVFQNFRGSQLSQGNFTGYRPLGLGPLKDGFDTVEWINSQPWSNHKVGSFGSSQGGYSQNFLAASAPPALVAQHLTDFGSSLFHHGYRPGGITRPIRFERLIQHARDQNQARDFRDEQLQHIAYDEWWDLENTTLHYQKMAQPALMVGSWFDPVSTAVIDTFNGRSKAFPGKQNLVLGPWPHGRTNKSSPTVGQLTYPTNSAYDRTAELIKFFDHHLKNAPAPNFPTIRYYTMGAATRATANAPISINTPPLPHPANTWRITDRWPPHTNTSSYYLLPNQTLSTNSHLLPPIGSTAYTADPYNPTPLNTAQFPAAQDTTSFDQRTDTLTFTTSPLTQPTEWTGPVRARIFINSSAPDTDLIVRLADVYPDGQSILLLDNIRRLSFRDSYTHPTPLKPNTIYPVDILLGHTSQVFNTNHRIRITIASFAHPYYELNPQTGLPPTINPPLKMNKAINTIHHNLQHASRIYAPTPPR